MTLGDTRLQNQAGFMHSAVENKPMHVVGLSSALSGTAAHRSLWRGSRMSTGKSFSEVAPLLVIAGYKHGAVYGIFCSFKLKQLAIACASCAYVEQHVENSHFHFKSIAAV